MAGHSTYCREVQTKEIDLLAEISEYLRNNTLKYYLVISIKYTNWK